MSSIVIDVLYVKMIERLIKRKLDALDLECVYFGEPIFFQRPSGELMTFVVPLYRLPNDLMSKDLDVRVLLQEAYDNASFFDHVFEVDPVIRVVSRG
jgi:hypothetical protein